LSLPIIESLIKKFFPEEQHQYPLTDDKEHMLKTIRLSKNIFSLTERLPKAKYSSPRVLSVANKDGSNSLLPQLANQNGISRNMHANTIQPPNQAQDENKPIIKTVKQKASGKPRSRL